MYTNTNLNPLNPPLMEPTVEAETKFFTELEENVNIFKRKHPGIQLYLIEVENDDAPLQFVLKQPDRKIMAAVAKLAHSDPFQSAVVLIENCLVYGDKAHLDDVSVFSAVSEKFESAMQSRKATIKNL